MKTLPKPARMGYKRGISNINIMKINMLIKYYTTQATTIILDGVSDICIYKEKPELSNGYDEFIFSEEKSEFPKYITYAKNGPCMLQVNGIAYVCNDDGKTIEKVGSGL